ncbi:tryptophan-rich sensory protein [Cellulomonas hominis]|uniref:Tryptophan-rich sensory protein n=1 Tax=Cellulomonas hominis TaxID=156981 RepID=A0A511F6U9_9CELL|nr:TspO/MBR family protein [Cellulomonas hominis]MBB5474982.1 tryptophan-rich sensory protein [Cellulomonas hominis]MBU5424409.1 tryptophan-rich sensory protein [Cellulomonas hominis]GEL45006.1 tryptophan-rich sensory protein [Cellulomonas hominis]
MTAATPAAARPAGAAAPAPRAGSARGWPVLAGLLLLNAAVAWGGSLASASGVDGWYADADKPAWTPPSWVFGPVWTVLYAVMAVAAWLIWRRHGFRAARTALVLYGVQLALNATWTPVFFGAERLGAGLAIILALEVALVATIVAFHRLTPWVAWLLGPYLAWVLYATTLNAGLAAIA